MASFRFLEDLQTLVTAELAGMGYPMPAGCDLDAAVMRYLNVVARIVPVLAWTLRTSRDLSARVLAPGLQAGFDEFKRKARAGEDLRPNMSTRIGNADYVDRMFYDWHLFHFHLGSNLDANGFASRTKELLFAIADRSSATMCMLDVRDHGSFEDQDLLRIIEENWPELLDPFTLHGIRGNTLSEAQIKALRSKGANSALQTPGGRALAPMGGGLTSAVQSLRNRRDADFAIALLQGIQKQLEDQRATIEDYVAQTYGLTWNDLEFRLSSFGKIVTVVEARSGEHVWSGPWPR